MATDYRSKVVTLALKEVGTVGGAATGDDKYIKYYNQISGASFSVSSTPWCAIFVTYCLRHANIPTDVCPNFAGCTTLRNSFLIPKKIYMPRSYIPKAGDLIMFDWNNSGDCDHVGIVECYKDGKVYTIEGNSKGGYSSYGVRHKSYNANSQYICGYGALKYDAISDNATIINNITSAITNISSSIQTTSVKKVYTKKFQTWMNTEYNMGLVVDGSYGPRSKQAAIKVLQTILNKEYHRQVNITGRYDAQTIRNSQVIMRYNKNDLVYLAQGILYAKGYDPNGFDGSFGPGMLNATCKYQSDKRLTPDGYIGSNTWKSLLT